MPYYYVNKNAQAGGEHEVHTTGCQHLPHEGNRVYLGIFQTCGPAKAEARKHYSNVDGCFYCCNPCHTK